MITILKKKIGDSILYDILNKPYGENTIYFNEDPVLLPVTGPDNVNIAIKALKGTYKHYIDNVEVDKDERNKQFRETKAKYFQYDEDTEYDIPITIDSKNERDIVKNIFVSEEVKELVELEYTLVELDYCESQYEFIKPLPTIGEAKALYDFRGISCANYIFKTICDKYDMKYSTTKYEFYNHKPMHREIEGKCVINSSVSRDWTVTQSAIDTYEGCMKRYNEIETVLKPIITNTIASLSKTVANAKTLGKIVDMVNEINITVYGGGKKDCSDRIFNKEKLNKLKQYITEIVLNDTVH